MTKMDWDRERIRKMAARRAQEPDDLFVAPKGGGGCWCGGAFHHDWPGKTEGAPHPREK